MAGLPKISSDARTFKEEAERAHRLASSTPGHLQGELLEIGALYELLAACNDPERQMPIPLSNRARSQTK